jgi:DHA2 family multidrug resistance protein-like MFS transporter
MASSLGAAFGVAISAAIFAALSNSGSQFPLSELFLGRTDNVTVPRIRENGKPEK